MNPQLQKFRKQLDEIDRSLLELLAQRFAVTEEVGKLKSKTGLPARDPAREEAQLQRISLIAQEYNLNPEYARSIMRITIDEVVKNHKKIRGNK